MKFRHADGTVERVRKVPKVQSRVGVERLHREILASLERSGSPKEAPMQTPTLAAFWPRFLQMHVRVNNKPSEQWTKERIMRVHLLPSFGDWRLDAVLFHHIEAYKSRMIGEGYKEKTINNHLAVLRTILQAAFDWRLLGQVPKVKMLRVPKKDVCFLDFPDVDRLVQAAHGIFAPMIVFALNTGLRIGEILALRWSDISLRPALVRVSRTDWLGTIGTPKGGCARSVPLNQKARGALAQVPRRPGGLVFCREDGRPFTYRAVHYALGEICRRSGGKVIGWHGLRHSFASHLVMRGVPLTAVQRLLGHSTQAMTERYAHLGPTICGEAVGVLD